MMSVDVSAINSDSGRLMERDEGTDSRTISIAQRIGPTRKSYMLSEIICIVLGSLSSIAYVLWQLTDKFFILGNKWDVMAFITVLHYDFFTMDLVLLIFVAFSRGLNIAIKLAFLGMDVITKDNVDMEMGSITRLMLLIGSTFYGIGMSVFSLSSFGKWLPQQSAASPNCTTFALQTGRSDAWAVLKIKQWIIKISSAFIYFSLQFIWTITTVLLFVNVARRKVKLITFVPTEGSNSYAIILRKYEKFTKIIRLWVKIYFRLLWGYDQLLGIYPDALYLSAVRYVLGVLSMVITYCLIKFSKYLNISFTGN